MNPVTLSTIKAIAEQIAPHCDGDEILLLDMIEGESGTDPRRLVEWLHEQRARDEEMLAGIKERKAAMAEREKRIKARSDKCKEQIGIVLRAVQLPKMELPEVTYSVREGNPKLTIADPEAVPAEFQVPKYSPDKRAINDAFADADELPNWLSREPATDIITARSK